MSSSAEPSVGHPAAGWPVPGTDGGVSVPWAVVVTGADGTRRGVAVRRVDGPDEQGRFVLVGEGAGFAAELRWGPADAAGGHDLGLTVTCLAPGGSAAAVGLVLRLAATPEPWLMIPGLFYGENRPAACTVPYPRWARGPADPTGMVADRWSFRADRAAVPVAIAGDGRRTAALVPADPGAPGDDGLPGLGIAADEDATEVSLTVPFAEQPARYDGGPKGRPGITTVRRWAEGEARTLRLRAYIGGPERHAFGPILRDLHARLAPPADERARPRVDLETAAALAAEGLLRWHWLAGERVILETAAWERGPGAPGAGALPGDRRAMHVAWLSGIPTAAALLAHGRRTRGEDAIRAGAEVIDNTCEHLAPAGTFWGQWTAAGGWGKGWTPGADRLHARTIAEATLFAARAAGAEAAAGVPRPSWLAAVERNLEFAASRRGPDGALCRTWHARTGAPDAWDGSAALAWVPALLEGARLLGRPAWADVAREAGRWYARFVESAFLHGAPEDVDLAPSSEDGYVAVMAYTALAEAAADADERAGWLALASRAADWALSFRYAWDVPFAPTTLLARHGYRTRGMDQASVANQHLHVYGLVCLPELVVLSRRLGDPWLARRAREHLDAARQLLVTADGELNGLRGMLPERAFQTDCLGPPGGIGMLSHAWCLGLLLWACEMALAMPELADGAR